jgi:hypothetical protein
MHPCFVIESKNSSAFIYEAKVVDQIWNYILKIILQFNATNKNLQNVKTFINNFLQFSILFS